MNDHSRANGRLAVLDTQSVLDWLYFNDARCGAWEPARAAGRWVWLGATPLVDELAHVLGRGHLPPRATTAAALLASVAERCCLAPLPDLHPPTGLRCSDPDDQKFIDLAVLANARWLVSRDKAVLKLRRRAAALHGLTISHPDDWQPERD